MNLQGNKIELKTGTSFVVSNDCKLVPAKSNES